jgi:hypothetical protein
VTALMWPIARDSAANVADSAWRGGSALRKTNHLSRDLAGQPEAEPVGTLDSPHSCDSARAYTLIRPH